MKRKFVQSVMLIILFSITSNYKMETSSKTSEILSVELDQLHIIEDRDIGVGEIYVKYIVNNGTPIFSSYFRNVIDGDILNTNLYMIANGNYTNFSIRIEIWESDSLHNEYKNDYLGHVEYSKSILTNTSNWHDAVGSIGGDNLIQAKLYIVETIGYIEIKTNKDDDFISDNFYVLVALSLISLFFISRRRKRSNKF